MFPLRQDRPWVVPPCSRCLERGPQSAVRGREAPRSGLRRGTGRNRDGGVPGCLRYIFPSYGSSSRKSRRQAVVCGEFAEQMLPEGGVGSRDLERQFVREERLRDLIRAGRGPSEGPVPVSPPRRPGAESSRGT